MKVCIIVPNLLPLPNVKGGAIETLVTDIINENEKQNKINLTVVSIYDKKAKEISKTYLNTKFIYIKKNITYIFKSVIIRILKIFGKSYNTYNEIVLKKIKNMNFDSIVVEDGAYKLFKNYLKYYNKNQMYLHFHHVGESSKSTDEVFGTFIGVSDFVVNNFSKSSKIKNMITLKNGVEVNKFAKKVCQSEISDIRKKLGFKLDDFVVIYLGRLIPEKGVLELVRSIKNIDNSKIKLMIVGSINFAKKGKSDYLIELEREISQTNGKIMLTGYIDNREIYKYFKSADLGVIPSTWEEAAGLVGIEGMLCGIPLIATVSGGMSEYLSKDTIFVKRGDNLESNLSNEIIKIANDREKRKKMIESGLKEAVKHSTSNFYNNFIRILKDK